MSKVFDLVLALFREPGLIAELRDHALPDDVGLVIRIAAGEAAALVNAAESTGESSEVMVEASVFYLQQILFAPNADPYRVLGAAADASQDLLRENYRWLMKWLHPDRNQDGWEAVYADRVNMAWQDLKTPERRADYDRNSPVASAMLPVAVLGTRRVTPMRAGHGGPLLSGTAVRRLPALVLGALGIAALSVIGLTYWAQTQTERELSQMRRDRAQPGTSLAIATTPAQAGPDLPTPTTPTTPEVELVAAAPTVAVSPDSPAKSSAGQETELVASNLVRTSPNVEVRAGSSEGAMPAAAPQDQDSLPVLAVVSSTPQAGAGLPAESAVAASLPPTVRPLQQPEPVAAVKSPGQIEPASDVSALASLPAAATATVVPAAIIKPSVSAPLSVPMPVAANPTAATAAPIKPLVQVPAPASAALLRSPAPAPAPAPIAAAPLRPSVPAPAPASIAPLQPLISEGSAVVAEPAQPVPAQGDAEALVREFAAAYAAGDLARFDRLFSGSDLRTVDVSAMRSRFDSTELRFIEIQQLEWLDDNRSVRARAAYKDTYVRRGERRAVTESGVIEWVISVHAGDARIASVDLDVTDR